MRGSSSEVSFVHQCSGMRITHGLCGAQCLMSCSCLSHRHWWRSLKLHSGFTCSVNILKTKRNTQRRWYQSTLFSSLLNSCRRNCFINNARVTGEGWRQIICIRPRSICQRGICKVQFIQLQWLSGGSRNILREKRNIHGNSYCWLGKI